MRGWEESEEGSGGRNGGRKRMHRTRKRACSRTRKSNEFFCSSVHLFAFPEVLTNAMSYYLRNGNKLTVSQIVIPLLGLEKPGQDWDVTQFSGMLSLK